MGHEKNRLAERDEWIERLRKLNHNNNVLQAENDSLTKSADETLQNHLKDSEKQNDELERENDNLNKEIKNLRKLFDDTLEENQGKRGQKAIRGSASLAPFLEDDSSSEDDLPDKQKKAVEPEPTSNAIPKPTSDEIPKPTSDEIPKPTTDEIPKPTSDAITEPTSVPIPDPTSDEFPEPTSDEVSQPSAEDFVVPEIRPIIPPFRDTRNITTTGIQVISDVEPSRTGTALAGQPPHRLRIGSAQVYSDVEPSHDVQGTTYATGSRPEDLVISDVQVISNIPPTTGATPAPVPAPVLVATSTIQALPSYLLKFLMLMVVLAMLFATLMGLGARRERDSWLAANEFTRRMAWHLRMGGGSGDGFGLLSWFLSDQSLNLKAGLFG